MKRSLFFKQGNIVYGTLVASALVAFLGTAGLLLSPIVISQPANMYIEPSGGRVAEGETFTVQVKVQSIVPVNVFKGEVRFDQNVLFVDSISYNTSIANLWAELPWYENGAGTVNFAGGTTQKGGFVGEGSLITITFRTHGLGSTVLRLEDTRVLAHDGFGTDVQLADSIDAIFSVEDSVIAAQTISTPAVSTTNLEVIPETVSTDLNGDGVQTIADMSIFMLNVFGSNDVRFDFNRDGVVDMKDFRIIMSVQ